MPTLLGQKHPAPRALGSPPGMGSRSPPLRVGILYSSCLWSPRQPPSNHRIPFLLFFAEGRPHSQPPPSSWDTPLEAVTPQGAFLPPFRGAPASVSPLSPGLAAAPHTTSGGWTSRASGSPCPSSRPSGQSSAPAGPQKCCPAPRAVLPTRAQHRAEVQWGDERSPTFQAGTLLLPSTEASPLLGSWAPLPAHLPTLPQEVVRKHRLPAAVSGQKSSSQSTARVTALSWQGRRPTSAAPPTPPTSGHGCWLLPAA